MNLSFQTKWPDKMGVLAGQPTFFVEKILAGILLGDEIDYVSDLMIGALAHLERVHKIKEVDEFTDIPKLHTIRHNPHDRWKAGNKIHFVINNRTKDRFQFAPVIPVVSVQEIEIIYDSANQLTEGFGFRIGSDLCAKVLIDRHIQTVEEIITLSKNDGFPHVDDFFMFFNKNFTGKIIHWTNLKY